VEWNRGSIEELQVRFRRYVEVNEDFIMSNEVRAIHLDLSPCSVFLT
jgi:hypothetical protein